MHDRRDRDDALAFNVALGLKPAGQRLPIEACRRIGAEIVPCLMLTRWRFTRDEPDEPHGSSKSPDECEF